MADISQKLFFISTSDVSIPLLSGTSSAHISFPPSIVVYPGAPTAVASGASTAAAFHKRVSKLMKIFYISKTKKLLMLIKPNFTIQWKN
ncbi:hypothetical protein KP509_03G005600 [Ceratopteris richardii]|uniref:Uncharacterized protein n=1 Tax=Ceratopteris richardii TaxID=49495 RepID=A0A8T2UX01_CERRI|nr:hypothetical protein KP509_03G005600 [Ceratopteris richardii]